MKQLILSWLELKDIPNRINQLEKEMEDLTELKDTLQREVMQDQPDLRHTLKVAQDNQPIQRKQLAEIIIEDLEISRATAYRKIKELQEKYQFLQETENGLTALSISSHKTQKIEK